MLTQAELEIILSILIVLWALGLSANIYWILNGWQIGAIRRTFAKVIRPRVEAYIAKLKDNQDEQRGAVVREQ